MASSAALVQTPPPPPNPGARVDPNVLARVDEYLSRGRGTPAEELIETLRGELSRQYERGFHDGWAKRIQQDARAQTGSGKAFSQRLRRRLRRRARAFLSGPHPFLRALAMLILVAIMSTAGAYATMTLSGASKAYAPVTIPR